MCQNTTLRVYGAWIKTLRSIFKNINPCTSIKMNGTLINVECSCKYLGHMVTNKLSDNWDIKRQMRSFIAKLNRYQTILQTFLNFFLNLTLSGVPHLYKQLPNGQYLSDLCKMYNLDANLWKGWIGDHRILTYIFKWERLNTAGHSPSVSIGHWVAPLHND